MALTPLFYMLAKHGPWSYHVRVSNTSIMGEVILWLEGNGKVEDKDFEILVEQIEHKHSKKGFAPKPASWGKTSSQSVWTAQITVEPIIFLNDASSATYIKLTWGGR